LFNTFDQNNVVRIDTINQNNTFEMANSEANKAVSISAIASVLSEDNENAVTNDAAASLSMDVENCDN
jgi:hypothetical protein